MASSTLNIALRFDLLQVPVADESGVLRVTFFNQLWMKNALSPGTEYVLYGKVERNLFGCSMSNPVAESVRRRGLAARPEAP